MSAYYTSSEAAAELGVGPEVVRKAALRGALGFTWAVDHHGVRFRAFSPSDIEAYKEERRRARLGQAVSQLNTTEGETAA